MLDKSFKFLVAYFIVSLYFLIDSSWEFLTNILGYEILSFIYRGHNLLLAASFYFLYRYIRGRFTDEETVKERKNTGLFDN